MASLDSALNRLQNILYKFDDQPVKKNQDKLIASLETTLSSISHITIAGKDDEISKRIIKVLNEIDRKIPHKLNTTQLKINELHHKIIQTKKVLLQKKVDISICYFSTSFCKDYNEVFLPEIKNVIKSNIPFVISKSLISGRDNLEDVGNPTFFPRRKEDFGPTFNKSNWQAYVHTNPEYGEETVFFVPKSLYPDKKGKERLGALDLKTDGSIKEISLREALSGPSGNVNFHGFTELFSKEPQKTKLFFVGGHGGISQPIAMSNDEFDEFLNFCDEQRCLGLLMFSCYSGGESMLLFKEKQNSFPIITESVGDWPACGTSFISNLCDKISSLKNIIEKPGIHSLSSFRKFAKKYTNRTANIPQIYIPQSHDKFIGSRSSGSKDAEQITMLTAQRQKILSLNRSQNIYYVDQKNVLLIHPAIIPFTLKHKSEDPTYISTTGGQAHHFIKKVELNGSTHEWIQNMMLKYKDVGVRKGFFIGSLCNENDPKDILEGVVSIFNPDQSSFHYYKKNNRYYTLLQNTIELEITPFQYALKCLLIADKTKPSSLALEAATVGYQSENLFTTTLEKHGYFTCDDLKITDILNMRDEEIMQLFRSIDNLRDREMLILFLLETNRESLIITILKEEDVALDFCDVDSTPLINLVVENNKYRVLEYLLEKNVNVNASNTRDYNTPLHIAVRGGLTPLVELLLKRNDIDVNRKNKDQETPLGYRYINDAIADLLLKHGANPTDLSTFRQKPMTAFVKQCMADRIKVAEIFLQNNVDPDVHEPHPLKAAIYNNNLSLAKQLLKYAANPFVELESGPPIIECITKGSPEMLNLLLNHENCDIEMKWKGESLITYAFLRGNDDIIDVLTNKGFKLSYCIPNSWLEEEPNLLQFRRSALYYFFRIHADDQEYVNKIHQQIKLDHPSAADLFIRLFHLQQEDRIPEI